MFSLRVWESFFWIQQIQNRIINQNRVVCVSADHYVQSKKDDAWICMYTCRLDADWLSAATHINNQTLCSLQLSLNWVVPGALKAIERTHMQPCMFDPESEEEPDIEIFTCVLAQRRVYTNYFRSGKVVWFIYVFWNIRSVALFLWTRMWWCFWAHCWTTITHHLMNI